MSHFSGGHGDWIEWDESGSKWTHNWVHDGYSYLIKKGESGSSVETRLIAAKMGELQISKTGEELTMFSLHERWRKPSGEPILAHIDDYYINAKDASFIKNTFPDDEIKRHIRAVQSHTFFSGPSRKRDPLLQKQLEADYLQRRAQFLSEFKAVLKSADQSWESLDLKHISPLP